MSNKVTAVLGALLFTAALGISCVSPGGAGGILFNSYSGPFQATDNKSGAKKGEASLYCILALACFGDAGIATASRKGNITKISAVDYHYMSVLGILFNSTTTIVTGE